MASRGSSPVCDSDVSSSDELPGDRSRSSPQRRGKAHNDTPSSQSLSRHSSSALRQPPDSRPTGGFSSSVNNDSFGQPLGQNTMFASTRPFNNHQNTTDVEQFLAEPPMSNQTFTPSTFTRTGDTLHVSANSSFVSIPKTGAPSVDVSSNTSRRTTNSVPPLVAHSQRQASSTSPTVTPLTATMHHDPSEAVSFFSPSTMATAAEPSVVVSDASGRITATQSSPLVAQSKPPMPTVIRSTSYSSRPGPFTARSAGLSEKTPSVLVASASSSGVAVSSSATGPRSPSRRTPSALFPSQFSAPVSTGVPPTQAAHANLRPASPSLNFTRSGSNHSLNSHASESASLAQLSDVGVSTLANYSPVMRSSLSPSNSAQQLPGGRYGNTAALLTPTASPPVQREGLVHTRSEGELRRLFSEPGNANTTSPAYGYGPVPSQMYRGGRESPGGAGRRSPSRQGGASVSVGSRQRGIVRATESSSGLGGTHTSSRMTPSGSSAGSGGVTQPRWMSAVERMKNVRGNEDLSIYDPVLPYDQSRLGLQTRQAGQQGMLTAGKLRALEAHHTGSSKASERGGLQPLVAYSVAGGRMGSPSSRAGASSPNRMPILTAQEEAIQATARYNRPMSEQAGGRRSGHIRSVANGGSVSAFGGARHNVTAVPSSMRGSVGGVITASESVTNGSYPGSVNNTFATRSEQGGIADPAHGGIGARLHTAEHRLANLFQLRSLGNNSGLHASEASTVALMSASGLTNGGWSNNNSSAVLRATEEQKAMTPRKVASPSSSGVAGGGGGGGGGGGDSTNGGGGGDGSSSDRNHKRHHRGTHSKRGNSSKTAPVQSKEVKQQIATEGDEDERDERNFRMRNINALHAIPWDQRRQLPMTGFGTRFFALLSTPRFWEKLDWTVRGSLLTVLPTMVLALEPATTGQFPMASSLAFNAFWITMPTFGSGLRELFIALKGFSFGLIFLIIVVATQPGPDWLLLLLLFVFTLFSSFVAEETKKTTAYVLASTIMQYLTDHKGTNFNYVGQYYEGLLIALAFGTAAFLVPFIRWSSDIARHYIKAMSNSLSIDLQGTLSSFWVRTPLERELNVMRLRQLRATAEKCIGKIETALDESGYEPHTGAYMMCMTNRFNFCKSIHNILGSLSHVIELIADNPSYIDTPMCNAFGEQIGDDLAVISSAMDSMVLKICDFSRIVTPQEIQFFREARERFQEAVSRVREDVILTNENYETDESDILLGFFMFSVDEICEVISQFEETANPPKTLVHALLFPIRDIKSVIFAFKNLALTIVRRRTIPRRLKEAIKLAVCMVLPCIFQVYALGNNSVSPMAGASVIALIYNPTGAESFHYASGRLLGTVLGSTASLLCVQIANGRRWVLYLFIVVLSFIGAYVQAAPGFYALGNAIVCSTISICTQYKDQNAAMVRIQQNCFAILMYFAVVCILWPMRARDKVKMSLDFSLRCTREAITRMLRNLDMPYDPSEITADVSALLMEMNKKVRTQVRFIPGATEEPTMGSVDFPQDAWKRIVEAERKLWLALSMMRFAYHTFMSSRADSTTELSVHWVVLHRISPHARDLSDLIYAAIDLYVVSLNNTTVVPTAHLTRLRVGMIEAQKAIDETYIRTISRKVAGEDSDDEEGEEEENDSYRSSYDEDEYYDPSFCGEGGQEGGAYPPPTTTNGRTLTTYRPEGEPLNTTRISKTGGGGGNDGAGAAGPLGPNDGSAEEKGKKAAGGNANAAAPEQQKGGGAHHKKRAARREGSDSSASSAHGDHDDGADEPKNKAKKKMGYLGYDLTEDEAAALRAFVADRVVNNNTFGLNRSMTGNMTFNNKSMAATAAAAAAVGLGATRKASMAGSPPAVNNDARLMAVSGGDDDLAAKLRKKHNIGVRKDKDEEKGVDKNDSGKEGVEEKAKAEGETQVENLANLNLTNASFFKNHSFLKNTSFLGSLFAKKVKEPADLDAEEMRGGEVSSSTSAASKSGKKDKKDSGEAKPRRTPSAMVREGKREQDDAASERSTPNTSPTRSGGGPRADPDSAASDFSDIEDEPREKQKSGGPCKPADNRDASKGKGAKAARLPPMARSTPLSPATAKGTGGSATANPLESTSSVQAQSGEQPVRMARSSPIVPTTSIADAGVGGSALSSAPQSALVPPLLLRPGGDSVGTIGTVGATSADEGHTPFGVTPMDARSALSGSAMQAPPLPATTQEPVAEGDEVANHHFSSSGSTPEDVHREERKADSRDSSNRTGNTEKKIVSPGDPEGNTTHSSSAEKYHGEGHDAPVGAEKASASPPKDAKGGVAKDAKGLRRQSEVDEYSLGKAAVSCGSHASNSMRYLSPRSASRAGDRQSNQSADRTAQLLRSIKNGDGDGESVGHFDEGEILNNISFFDPAKGEFVLTNHDIHSLEAFLFGTQALVTYINELQKAILEMQHETELAKRL